MKTIIALATAGLFLSPAAFAQTTTGPATPNSPPVQIGSNDTSAKLSTIQQRMKSDLRKDGFTNVKVMPNSFLVTAKDKSGNPVTMIIGPMSMTEVVAQAAPGASTSSGSRASRSDNNAATTGTTSQ
jgi:hypothetical protein